VVAIGSMTTAIPVFLMIGLTVYLVRIKESQSVEDTIERVCLTVAANLLEVNATTTIQFAQQCIVDYLDDLGNLAVMSVIRTPAQVKTPFDKLTKGHFCIFHWMVDV
jgi:hypothetical protein